MNNQVPIISYQSTPQIPFTCPAPPLIPPGQIGGVIGFCIYWAIWGHKQQQKRIDSEVERKFHEKWSMFTASQPQQSPQKPSVAQSTETTRQMEKRLITMLQGNRETALRLVQSVRKQHPNQPAAWCWEKAIEDLERDRC